MSRVRPYTKLGEECGPFVAAHISGFDAAKYVEDRRVLPKGASRQSLLAVVGAILALDDAKISWQEFREGDGAIVSGSSLMDFGGIVGSIDAVAEKGLRGAQQRTLYSTGVSSVPSAVNTALSASARTMAVSTQCCAGLDAIGRGADLVANGDADLVICGGAEAPLHRFPMLEFREGSMTPATAEMPERISRPFDLWRTTGVVSEGACMFVLEPEGSPRPGYSFVEGYAFANDTPGGLCDGLTVSGRLAIAAAGLRPSGVDTLNAWGPGHRLIDSAECIAMRDLFGERLGEMPAVSIKGAIGTALAGAPAIQLAAAALAQRSGEIPPTVNWEYPDPTCPLNLSNRSRLLDHEVTLLNAHGVGGVNASLVLRRC